MVEIGRVALVNFGPDAGKTAAIVDVIDQNRALVDGPLTGVKRQAVQFRRLRLTRLVVGIPRGTSTKIVKKAWEKQGISKAFAATKQSLRLERDAKVSFSTLVTVS